MALQSYQYPALPSARSFRLFDLLGGSGEEIKIKLDTFSFDEPPDYDIISLDWAHAADKSSLTINEASASAPAPLISALREFRKSMTMTTTKFWTDAVCINSASESERSAQGRIRPDILGKASSVHIWIPGDNPDTIQSAINCVKQGQVMLDSMLRNPDGYADETELTIDYFNKALARAKYGRPWPGSHDWSPLRDLISKPWFKKKLAIQESSWVSAAFLHYGSSMIPYDQLGRLVIQLRRSKEIFSNRPSIEDLTVSRASLLYEYRVRRQSPGADQPNPAFNYHTLFKVTASFGFDCEDPRDHLYSLVSMINEYDAQDELLRPDYSLSWQEAFTNFAIWALRREPDLCSLSNAAGPSDILPSWVCDLTKKETRATLAVPKPVFRAGGTEKDEIDISPDRKVLKLSAKIVDSIKAIQPAWRDRTVPDTIAESETILPGEDDENESDEEYKTLAKEVNKKFIQQLGWFNSCIDMASQGGHASPDGPCGMTERRFEEFWRTLGVEFINVRTRGTDDSKAREAFLHYAVFAKDKDTSVLSEAYKVANGRFQEPPPNARRAGVLETDTALGYALAVTKFCTTAGDRLALVPNAAEPGDEICVIPGAQVPYAIRRSSSGRYQLVGECYLGGMMDGEAMGKDDIPLQPIEIE